MFKPSKMMLIIVKVDSSSTINLSVTSPMQLSDHNSISYHNEIAKTLPIVDLKDKTTNPNPVKPCGVRNDVQGNEVKHLFIHCNAANFIGPVFRMAQMPNRHQEHIGLQLQLPTTTAPESGFSSQLPFTQQDDCSVDHPNGCMRADRCTPICWQ